MGHALSEPPRGNLGADSEYRRELGVSIVQDAPWTVSATLCYREHELGFSYACEICVARCTMRGDIVLHYPRLYNGTYETHVGMPAWFGSWITWKGHCVKRLERCKAGLDLVESWRRTVKIPQHFSGAVTSGIRAELLLMGGKGVTRRVGIIPGGNGCPSGILLRGDIFFASAEPRYYWIGNQYSCSGTVCAEWATIRDKVLLTAIMWACCGRLVLHFGRSSTVGISASLCGIGTRETPCCLRETTAMLGVLRSRRVSCPVKRMGAKIGRILGRGTFTTSLSGGALGQSSGTLWGQGDFGQMGKPAIPPAGGSEKFGICLVFLSSIIRIYAVYQQIMVSRVIHYEGSRSGSAGRFRSGTRSGSAGRFRSGSRDGPTPKRESGMT
ncbi:hypothetical protein ACOSQ2_003234 [Xanthoceras sorbifolium]